jgi:hypothetical protein
VSFRARTTHIIAPIGPDVIELTLSKKSSRIPVIADRRQILRAATLLTTELVRNQHVLPSFGDWTSMQLMFHGNSEVMNIEMVPMGKFKMGLPKSD